MCSGTRAATILSPFLTGDGDFGDGHLISSTENPPHPCRARQPLHWLAVRQARSMLRETPASPPFSASPPFTKGGSNLRRVRLDPAAQDGAFAAVRVDVEQISGAFRRAPPLSAKRPPKSKLASIRPAPSGSHPAGPSILPAWSSIRWRRAGGPSECRPARRDWSASAPASPSIPGAGEYD